MRTFPLVAMASCGFVQASENLLVHSPDGMAKVIEGLITGIGFGRYLADFAFTYSVYYAGLASPMIALGGDRNS